MKKLKYILLGVGAAILLALAYTFTLSSTYYLDRSTEIQAPREKVLGQVNDLKNWPTWSPWYEKFGDGMKLEYSDVTDEEGGWYSWDGEESGKGKMTITKMSSPDSVVYNLEFDGQAPAQVVFRLEETSPETTKVTWVMSGDVGANPIGKVFASMMDNMLGPDFERGLENLKNVSEK